MFLDVENAIQIKPNNFLIIHHFTYHSGTCRPVSYHKFGLSLFDLKSNQITKIFNQDTERNNFSRIAYRFNYFMLKDNFIYQICVFPYDIDDIERLKKNKKSFSSNYNLFKVKTQKNILDLKTEFRLISYYKDDLLFAQDYQNLNICYLKDDIITSVYKFYFNNSNLCALKNNDFIVFGEKKIWREIKEKGIVVCRSCDSSIKYFDYYQKL
jgi:hypothetical protein